MIGLVKHYHVGPEGLLAICLTDPLASPDIIDCVVAFAEIEINETSYKIIRLRVHQDYRRQGLGSQLLTDILYSAKIESAIVEVGVDASNLGGQLFLQRAGAIATGEGFDHVDFVMRPEWIGDGALSCNDEQRQKPGIEP